MTIEGRCLCQSVRYKASAPAIVQFNCHCRDCQRSTGAAFAPVMFFAKNALSIEGPLSHYESLSASGSTIKRSFCQVCGAQMLGETQSAPMLISIRAGTLDDPSQYQPMADIFCSQAAPWDCLNPEIGKFADMLPAPKR